MNKFYLRLLVETRQVPSQHLLDPTICALLQHSSVKGQQDTMWRDSPSVSLTHIHTQAWMLYKTHKSRTVRASRRGSSSQTACPGRSEAPGWRWAAPLWTDPCLAAAASADSRSDLCSPLTLFPLGTPRQPEVTHADRERGTWVRMMVAWSYWGQSVHTLTLATTTTVQHSLFYSTREVKFKVELSSYMYTTENLVPHLSHLLCALLYVGCGLWPRGQLIWLVHVALLRQPPTILIGRSVPVVVSLALRFVWKTVMLHVVIAQQHTVIQPNRNRGQVNNKVRTVFSDTDTKPFPCHCMSTRWLSSEKIYCGNLVQNYIPRLITSELNEVLPESTILQL